MRSIRNSFRRSSTHHVEAAHNGRMHGLTHANASPGEKWNAGSPVAPSHPGMRLFLQGQAFDGSRTMSLFKTPLSCHGWYRFRPLPEERPWLEPLPQPAGTAPHLRHLVPEQPNGERSAAISSSSLPQQAARHCRPQKNFARREGLSAAPRLTSRNPPTGRYPHDCHPGAKARREGLFGRVSSPRFAAASHRRGR